MFTRIQGRNSPVTTTEGNKSLNPQRFQGDSGTISRLHSDPLRHFQRLNATPSFLPSLFKFYLSNDSSREDGRDASVVLAVTAFPAPPEIVLENDQTLSKEKQMGGNESKTDQHFLIAPTKTILIIRVADGDPVPEPAKTPPNHTVSWGCLEDCLRFCQDSENKQTIRFTFSVLGLKALSKQKRCDHALFLKFETMEHSAAKSANTGFKWIKKSGRIRFKKCINKDVTWALLVQC